LRAFPPLQEPLGRLVRPSLGKEVDLKLCTRWGLRGTPLGLLPPLGREGVTLTTIEDLKNNSKIKDFYRAKKLRLF
jgi:hypothetical protein